MNRERFRTYYINGTMSRVLTTRYNIMYPVDCTSVLFELTYGCEHSATIKYGV